MAKGNICECCERNDVGLSKHHLIPRTTHKNKRIKKLFPTKEERNETTYVCILCHKAFHDFFKEKELALDYNTLEKLKNHPAIQKHIKWVKKQQPGSEVKGKIMNRKNKQYRRLFS